MGKIKDVFKSFGFVIIAACIFLFSAALSIFCIVAAGICGSDCPDKMNNRMGVVYGKQENNADVWTPILVTSVVGIVSTGVNSFMSHPKFQNKKFAKIISPLMGLLTLGIFIWYISEHYIFWNGVSGDALSSKNKHLFICGDEDTPLSDCPEKEGTEDIYLMYYADVIYEFLFYFIISIIVLGVILSIVLCVMKKKNKEKLINYNKDGGNSESSYGYDSLHSSSYGNYSMDN